MIYQSILELIGNTPIVHLGALSGELGLDVYVKLESSNPGGSHKARIALGMILDAERKDILVRGEPQTIVEPSGGNTGIGLAIAGNILGYKVVLVIPDNYSPEKQQLLQLYGAEVVLSDSRLGNNSHGQRAMELQLENPTYVMLNQQRNSANPETHRHSTAQEIIRDFGDREVDCFVAGIGTGGISPASARRSNGIGPAFAFSASSQSNVICWPTVMLRMKSRDCRSASFRPS